MLFVLVVVSGLFTSIAAGYTLFHALMVARQLWAVMVIVVAKGDPKVARAMEQLAGDSVKFCAVWFAAATVWLMVFLVSALRFVLAGLV